MSLIVQYFKFLMTVKDVNLTCQLSIYITFFLIISFRPTNHFVFYMPNSTRMICNSVLGMIFLKL